MTFLPKLMGSANELLAFPVGRPDRSEVTACVPQLLVAFEIPNASSVSVILQRFIGETIRMTRRCFVISPIAAHNSEIREHADDVFDFIIKPAMDELGIEAYRSDHSQEIGRITEQMFSSILNDDLCIAVLTYFNPNVFYELAIAQSAARPVIILIEKGHTIPFDVRDLRAVEYDLSHETGIIQSVYHQLCRLHWALGRESVQSIVDLFESNGRLSHVKDGSFGDCRK